MQVFDDKTLGIINANGRLMLDSPINSDDMAFKATYYVLSDLSCSGKITALFDLYVLGNVSANEIDVKGKFVCLGRCEVSDTVVVQNDLICSTIEASCIICHENIYAQDIDAKQISCDGKIIVEKTLAIEELAKCEQTVICGETAYGAGKIVANTIITSEPIDLDDGEDGIVSPYTYEQESNGSIDSYGDIISGFSKQFCENNQYKDFLETVIQYGNENQKHTAVDFLGIFDQCAKICSKDIANFRDTKLLLDLLSLINSGWFDGWQIVDKYRDTLLSHFEALAKGVDPYLPKPKPASVVKSGDYIKHISFGNGYVKDVVTSSSGSTVIVDFENHGIKHLALPVSLKFITLLGDRKSLNSEAIKASLVCNINNYREWVECLKVLYDNAESMSPDLHGCIYDLLMINLGLKSKFVLDRFQEKGWKINGK